MRGVLASLPGRAGQFNWTIASLLGLLIITALASIPLTLTILHNRESDALVIDMAGRQRMLLERYTKEVLLAADGVPARHDETLSLLRERLQALIHGGSTSPFPGREQTITLARVPTSKVHGALIEQERLLDSLSRLAETYLSAPPRSADSDRLRDQLLQDSADLLITANEAVALLAQESDARMTSLIRWEIIVVILVVSVAALGTWGFLKAEQELAVSQTTAMEALRQSDAVKSSLLSSVSHELRTPLTAMKSMLFSLRHGPWAGPSREELVQSIDEQIDYLNRLVGNLLDMSRLDAGMLQPRREWHLLEELIEGAVRRVETLLKERRLDIDLEPDLPPISVDAVQIQQVLINLLDNAVKFSPPGSDIRLNASFKNGELEVALTNSGQGIPADQTDRIFDRFYRTPTGVASRPGTGLGLAISKAIIEAHGGRITAQSTPGEETTFRFQIPVAPTLGTARIAETLPAGRTA